MARFPHLKPVADMPDIVGTQIALSLLLMQSSEVKTIWQSFQMAVVAFKNVSWSTDDILHNPYSNVMNLHRSEF